MLYGASHILLWGVIIWYNEITVGLLISCCALDPTHSYGKLFYDITKYSTVAYLTLQNDSHTSCDTVSLSHPVLGWLYVFSPFPPRPPPQKLFPLTSKPFELDLWYLAQRIYGSGELYWMTFPWPWPKVTAVASISQNVLVCAIKWEQLIRSLQNVAALLP